MKKQVISSHLGPREVRLFEALLDEDNTKVSVTILENMLTESGLSLDDRRLKESMAALARATATENDDDERPRIDKETFCEAIRHNILLIEQALQGRLVIPEFPAFCAQVKKIYETVKENREGAAADYIPQLDLKGDDLDRFAVALCTVDGQRYAVGDTDTFFSVQSTTKPFAYCMALEEHGPEVVHKHIGREPSGVGFNELTLNRNNKPHNPMINSGAIMSSSLVGLTGRPDEADPDFRGWSGKRFEQVMDYWRQLCGGQAPRFSTSVFLSERETADRNFALAYMMRERGGFPEKADLHDVLEFYFQMCSIEMNAQMMSVVAGTLANGGICPIVGKRVFSVETVRNCLSMMAGCGMYDYSGEFAFRIGLPAKSGVSGAVVVVVPNVAGFCTYSPRLDEIGNSARGVEFFQHLVTTFNFHQFDNLTGGLSKHDPRLNPLQLKVRHINEMIWAASKGDIGTMQELVLEGSEWGCADYDMRTPLHLAAAENEVGVVRLFIELAADKNSEVSLSPVDRWGSTPLDSARRHGCNEAVDLLVAAGARTGSPGSETRTAQSESPENRLPDSDRADELVWAASLGNMSAIRRLVASGLSLDVCDYDYRTPLHLAAAEGHTSLVQYFLRQGVTINPTDRWGGTPLDDARRHGHDKIAELLSGKNPGGGSGGGSGGAAKSKPTTKKAAAKK